MYLRFTHFWMWGYMYMWESYCVQYLHVYTNVSLSVLCIMCTHVCVCAFVCACAGTYLHLISMSTHTHIRPRTHT